MFTAFITNWNIVYSEANGESRKTMLYDFLLISKRSVQQNEQQYLAVSDQLKKD